jgi:hypothetical protein
MMLKKIKMSNDEKAFIYLDTGTYHKGRAMDDLNKWIGICQDVFYPDYFRLNITTLPNNVDLSTLCPHCFSFEERMRLAIKKNI